MAFKLRSQVETKGDISLTGKKWSSALVYVKTRTKFD